MTTHEVIDLIANTYTLHTRSVNDYGNCMYVGNNNRICAFAMMVLPEMRYKLKESAPADNLLIDGIITQQDLLPEFRGFDNNFYYDMQYLHDKAHFWTDNGLSEEGKIEVEHLKDIW